jgi:hypothetical protein
MAEMLGRYDEGKLVGKEKPNLSYSDHQYEHGIFGNSDGFWITKRKCKPNFSQFRS